MIDISNEVAINIVFDLIHLFAIIEKREQVYREYGVVVEVRSKENGHNIPHIHAKYNNFNVSIDIMECKILAGNLPKNQMNIAIEFVKKNQQFLLEKWRKYHDYKFSI